MQRPLVEGGNGRKQEHGSRNFNFRTMVRCVPSSESKSITTRSLFAEAKKKGDGMVSMRHKRELQFSRHGTSPQTRCLSRQQDGTAQNSIITNLASQ